ncbi:hypothetical protein [Methylobacterium planeticum]|uniref:Uncharacterized protein n=1 Tax=Methylobacterium planeticum TaxID=2615211 RepID=A0A6N6MTL1_9HYPH|nr:hypothetical protein [Methylobacterium planeticum]KAB1074319.1 hypothetical protein F6X51_08045 [Methylobacterium planeticum]
MPPLAASARAALAWWLAGLALPEARIVGLDVAGAGGIAPAAAEALLPRIAACAALLVGPGILADLAPPI